MVRKLAYGVVVVLLIGAAAFWILTAPQKLDDTVLASLRPPIR